MRSANYNQGNRQLNALAGLVSLLPATHPSVLRLRGGNAQLPPRLLLAANATLHWPAAVTAIVAAPDGQQGFMLEVGGGGNSGGDTTVAAAAAAAAVGVGGAASVRRQHGGGQRLPLTHGPISQEQLQGPFDAVIIAAPLTGSGLTFRGLRDVPTIPGRNYQQTTTTIVHGSVRSSYFGVSGEMPYSEVLVAEGAGVPWSSLSRVGTAPDDGVPLWKLASTEAMPHAWLEMMFERGYTVVTSKTWAAPGAYPAFVGI